MDTEYNKWVKAGLLDDVSAYMDKYTVIRDYYNKMDPKTLFYASEADGSIYRIRATLLTVLREPLDPPGLAR